MTDTLLQYANLIQLLVLSTFGSVLVRYERGNVIHQTLLAILVVSLSNELVSYYYLIKGGTSPIFYSVSVLLHNSLWLFLLSRVAHLRQVILYTLVAYVAFAIFNLTLLEGTNSFNSNIFIVGAVFYLFLFIIESFHRLKLEQLSFFTNSNYILLCAPLLLFISLSFIFGFKSKTLYDVKIFGNVQLYEAITHFANIVYYTLINVYIFRRKTKQDGI